jgi:antitoxin CptB
MDLYRQNKLKWKCRRGLLELDLVLTRFLPHVQDAEMQHLDEILEFPDNDLWDVVIGRSDRFEPHLNAIVARLRAA